MKKSENSRGSFSNFIFQIFDRLEPQKYEISRLFLKMQQILLVIQLSLSVSMELHGLEVWLWSLDLMIAGSKSLVSYNFWLPAARRRNPRSHFYSPCCSCCCSSSFTRKLLLLALWVFWSPGPFGPLAPLTPWPLWSGPLWSPGPFGPALPFWPPRSFWLPSIFGPQSVLSTI